MVLKISMPGQPEPIGLDRLIREMNLKKLQDALSGVLEQLNAIKQAGSSGAMRRSLMGFDQLNRLTAGRKSGTEDTGVEKLLEFLKDPSSLEKVILDTVRFGDSIRHELMNSSEFLTLMRKLFDDLSDGGSLVSRALGTVNTAMKGVAQEAGYSAGYVQSITREMLEAAAAAEESGSWIKGAWGGMGGWFHTTVHAPIKADIASLWDGLEPGARDSLQAVKGLFSDTGSHMAESFKSAWLSVEQVFDRGGSVFDGLTDGVLTGFKSMVNRLISGINQVVVEPFSGINDAFSKLKGFSIGGMTPFKNLNFSISMPRIPYLAQGAVLPANKPFMAVVGDQKHGTNIEAPLDVIRQAVAEVLAESVDAQLAGHSATVEVLKQILEAVLGISLDDAAVTAAVERQQRRMAVMKGGF